MGSFGLDPYSSFMSIIVKHWTAQDHFNNRSEVSWSEIGTKNNARPVPLTRTYIDNH